MLLLPLAAIAAAVLTAVRAAPADDPGTVVGSPELQAARGAARGAAALDNPWAPSGGSGAGGAGRSIMRLFGSGAGGGEHEYDVRSFGAKGDAFTDDTAAFQAAFDACIEGGGGDVLVPPGNYMMAGTVTVKCDQTTPHSLRGAGWSSNLLWAGDADLIVWTNPPPITVAELAISSIKSAKSVNSTALRVGVGPNVGAQRCEFDHLLFYGAGTVPNTTYTATFIGTALNLGNESDTTTIRDCIFWFVGGKGIVIGHGSEIRIEGGRIVGSVDNAVAHTYQPNTTAEQAIRNGSIGIHVTGNNGGVHVLSTDVIGHAVGMLVEDATGAGSNREIMITHATFDSDRVGLLIRDSSYVSIAGCWAASSDIAQVWLAPTAHGSQLTIAGGTIFNGGAYQHSFGIGECAIVGGCNGLIADAGTFLLTGLLIRNNKGVGVAVRSEAVKHYSITGCQLFGNGVGMDLQGQGYAVTGNVFHDNQKPNVVRIDDKGGAIIASNVGWDPSRGSGGHASRRGTKTDDAESSMMVGVADNTPSSTPETSIIAAAAPTAAAQDKYIAVWSIHEGGGCNDTAFSEITINTCADGLLGDGSWTLKCNAEGTNVTVGSFADDLCQAGDHINFPLNKCIFGATEQGWSSFACVKKYTPVGPGVLVKDYTTPTCSGPSPFVTTFFQPGCFNGPPNSRRSFSTTANRTDLAQFIHGEHKGCTGLFKETFHWKVGSGCVVKGTEGYSATYFP